MTSPCQRGRRRFGRGEGGAVEELAGGADARRSGRPAAGSPSTSTTTSTSRWPVGCSTSTCELSAASRRSARARPRRAAACRSTTLTAAEHADRGVRLHRDERRGCRPGPPSRGGGEQHRLRHGRRGHVAQAHQLPGLAAEARRPARAAPSSAASSLVGLVAGEAERLRRIASDDRHAVVDAGDLDAVDRVPRRCRWAAGCPSPSPRCR